MLDSDKFDLAIGIISIVAFPTVIVTIIYNLLPSTRLVELETVFTETEGLLKKNFEAGLLGPQDIAAQFHRRISLLERDIEDVRVESHCATTYIQNVKKMLGGLSRRIFYLCNEVKELRADISTTSARERERLRRSQASASGEEVDRSMSSPGELSTSMASNVASFTSSEHDPNVGNVQAEHGHDMSITASPTPPGTGSLGLENNLSSTACTESLASLATTTLVASSDQSATVADEQNDVAPQPSADHDGGRKLLSPSPRASICRPKRYGDSHSRMRVFARLLRGKPSRAPSSSDSTRGLMLVPSRSLSSIEVAPDGDDAEWEDLAVCQVLPV
ncbi:hypothetical protein FKP32DRAFT_1588846 [Trametes sanguinea]|nr:hypothetical protein FKP32DRAFT_1588846 [Trametes sanguinea]